jgi:hypothetical protein
MEVRAAHKMGSVGHWVEESSGFGPNANILGEDELSSALVDLRACVDPFLLAAWVGEEANALGCNARMPEMFDRSAECSPRILLCVLAYSYTRGVFSSEEIVRNCRTNGVFGVLAEGKFLFRQELTRFRRRHRALLAKLIARVFVRFVSEWFGFNRRELPACIETYLERTAIDRLDIARHLDTSDE